MMVLNTQGKFKMFLISFYIVPLIINLILIIAAIFNRNVAKRMELIDWGDVLAVCSIIVIPLANFYPLIVFFKIKLNLNRPLHED